MHVYCPRLSVFERAGQCRTRMAALSRVGYLRVNALAARRRVAPFRKERESRLVTSVSGTGWKEKFARGYRR